MISSYEDKPAAAKNKPKNERHKEKKFKPPKKISDRYLYNSGLAYLQRFPASSSHFRSVMMRKIDKSCRHHVDQNKDDCAKMLDELIPKFQDLGLLDDAAYLKGMVVSYRRRGLSSTVIRLRLQQKGYKTEEITEELAKHDAEEYENSESGDINAALIFARKKRLGPFDPQQKKSPEKSLASMARAGYSYDIAKRVLETTETDLD